MERPKLIANYCKVETCIFVSWCEFCLSLGVCFTSLFIAQSVVVVSHFLQVLLRFYHQHNEQTNPSIYESYSLDAPIPVLLESFNSHTYTNSCNQFDSLYNWMAHTNYCVSGNSPDPIFYPSYHEYITDFIHMKTISDWSFSEVAQDIQLFS